MSSGSKKEPRYACLSEAKASHSQRMWAEASSAAPRHLHNGLSDSPITWRCLLRVLCPVRRPVTALYCVLLKDRNIALAPRQGPETSSRAYLWVSPRPRHHAQSSDCKHKMTSRYGGKLRIEKEQQMAVLWHVTQHFTSSSPKPHTHSPHPHHPPLCDHPFIPLACAECDDPLPFSGASSIPLF